MRTESLFSLGKPSPRPAASRATGPTQQGRCAFKVAFLRRRSVFSGRLG